MNEYFFMLCLDRLMPPSFLLPKSSVYELDYGGSANITCQANGMPKPRVKWQEGVCVCVCK